MFGLGPIELGIILVIALVIFGPKKLPEVGKALGKLIEEVKKYSRGFEEEVKREFYDASLGEENSEDTEDEEDNKEQKLTK